MTCGLILDQRYKLDFVQYTYREMHGDSTEHYIEEIRRTLNEVYIEYKGIFDNSSCYGSVFVTNATDSSN